MKKKTVIKTSLLILAVAGAISAILLLKSSIEAPTISFKDGLYGAMLSKELKPSTGLSTLKDIDDYCRVKCDLLLACEEEQVLSGQEQDNATNELFGHLFPLYPNVCDSKFSSSWGSMEANLILHIDTMLKAFRLSNGSYAYRSNENYSSPLDRVDGYAREYHHAIRFLSKQCDYPGSIAKAKEKLGNANKYRNSPYSNSPEIQLRIKKFPVSMGQSHYNTVSSLLNKGCNYLNEADAAIRELDANKLIYSGYIPDIASLKKELNNKYDACNN